MTIHGIFENYKIRNNIDIHNDFMKEILISNNKQCISDKVME